MLYKRLTTNATFNFDGVGQLHQKTESNLGVAQALFDLKNIIFTQKEK